ncbi:MAG: GNAT family N-acetyltransferase [Oleiphilaceae bacterium]|nr:GNAT family N-acetyltransferase [Oleiphilaceae bacterium]
MTELLSIRPYLSTDREACLAVYDSNLPEYFAEGERAYFEAFLDYEIAAGARYFVVETEADTGTGRLSACGGFSLNEGCVYLRWGMVARHAQRQGLGKQLLAARLRLIEQNFVALYPGQAIRIHTSPLTKDFYLQHGFVVEKVVTEGLGPGLDQVCMVRPFAEVTSTATQ